MDCNVFKRVDVWRMAHGGTLVCWELSQNFWQTGPLKFFVDLGREGTDDWVALNREPLVDVCCFSDECSRDETYGGGLVYRVRLVVPVDGQCVVYKSQPVGAIGRLDKKDWLRARDIIRREHLQQRAINGTQGFLLKLRRFGVKCPRCLDWDTREVQDSNCPVCYGTGIVGGYYPGIEYWLTTDPNWGGKTVVGQPPRGTFADTFKMARGILYPDVDTKDVWINANTDQRYVVDHYVVITEMRGVPLIGMLQIRLAPASDVIYNVPVDGTPQSSSSSGEDTSCDVRNGLDSSYEDW